MGYQEKEELFLTLSRKELQRLCRKQRLPTNRCKSQLARLLVLHLTKKKKKKKKNQRGGSCGRELGCNQSSVSSEEVCEDDDGVREQQGECLLNPCSKNLQRVKCSKKTGFAHSHSAPEEVPAPFEFFVRSEEGLNLVVDFNCKLLDWIRGNLDRSWTISDGVRDAFVQGRRSFEFTNPKLRHLPV